MSDTEKPNETELSSTESALLRHLKDHTPEELARTVVDLMSALSVAADGVPLLERALAMNYWMQEGKRRAGQSPGAEMAADEAKRAYYQALGIK